MVVSGVRQATRYQDALPRPTGALPSGTPYPAFSNSGARQPKFNGRADYELLGRGTHDDRGRRGRHGGHHPYGYRSRRHRARFAAGLRHGRYEKAAAAWRCSRTSCALTPQHCSRSDPTGGRFLWTSTPRRSTSRPSDIRAIGYAPRAQLRRQLSSQRLRHLSGTERRGPQRGRRVSPGRDLHQRTVPLDRRRPYRQVHVDRRRRVLAAHDASLQAGQRAHIPRLVQSRVPRRHRSSTTVSTSRCHPGDSAGGGPVCLSDAAVGDPELDQERSQRMRLDTRASSGTGPR